MDHLITYLIGLSSWVYTGISLAKGYFEKKSKHSKQESKPGTEPGKIYEVTQEGNLNSIGRISINAN